MRCFSSINYSRQIIFWANNISCGLQWNYVGDGGRAERLNQFVSKSMRSKYCSTEGDIVVDRISFWVFIHSSSVHSLLSANATMNISTVLLLCNLLHFVIAIEFHFDPFKSLRVVGSPWNPFVYVDKHGVRGIDISLVRVIADKLNFSIDIQLVTSHHSTVDRYYFRLNPLKVLER